MSKPESYLEMKASEQQPREFRMGYAIEDCAWARLLAESLRKRQAVQQKIWVKVLGSGIYGGKRVHVARYSQTRRARARSRKEPSQ